MNTILRSFFSITCILIFTTTAFSQVAANQDSLPHATFYFYRSFVPALMKSVKKIPIYINDSLVYKVTIAKQDYTMYQTIQTTKFGFIYIDSLRCNGFDNSFDRIIGDKSQHDKIFWSNPLYLNERN